MSLEETDALGGRGATHPRITLEWMKSQIDQYHCFDCDEMFRGLGMVERVLEEMAHPTGVTVAEVRGWATEAGMKTRHMTLCIMVMNNGFIVIGKSAPMSPLNFDPEKGKTFAYEDCIRQLWPMYAFAELQRSYTSD